MRRWSVWLVTLLVLGAGAVGGRSAGAVASDDWLVATVVAGAAGADDVLLEISGTARAVGAGNPIVWGSGESLGGYAHVRVDLIDSAERVVMSTPAGRHEVELEPMMEDSRLTFSTGYWLSGEMSAGETLTVLLFLPGMSFEDLDLRSSASAGTVQLRTTRGSGSRVIGIAEPGDLATAVVAPSHAAGTTEHVAEVPAGIVGGTVPHTAGVGTWQGPDGDVHPVIDAEGNLLDRAAFAGPAGRWRWTWTGATSDDAVWDGPTPIVGAYAPIGDHWTAFAS